MISRRISIITLATICYYGRLKDQPLLHYCHQFEEKAIALVSSYMTWKERKEFENKKLVSLGGKPPKKQRLPLSVARVVMKKQKERDQSLLQENMIVGRFGIQRESSTKKVAGKKRKPEDRVLKLAVDHFRDGVLDAKQLLKPVASSRGCLIGPGASIGKKKHNKKGGGWKRH